MLSNRKQEAKQQEQPTGQMAITIKGTDFWPAKFDV